MLRLDDTNPNVKWLRRYESWSEYVEQIESARNQSYASTMESSITGGGTAGDGCNSWSEALTLIKEGWETIRPEVTNLTDELVDDMKVHIPTTFNQVWDVAGANVDMDRYLTGEPECMTSIVPMKVATVGRVITILVHGFYAWHIEPENIKRRGVAICALIETLNLLQHSTEVWVETPVKSLGAKYNRGDTCHVTLVKVKDASEELDIERMMFAIAHPANFRRAWFRHTETMPNDEIKFIGSCYGIQHKELTQGKNVDATIELGVLDYEFPDGLKWVKDNLMQFGLWKG